MEFVNKALFVLTLIVIVGYGVRLGIEIFNVNRTKSIDSAHTHVLHLATYIFVWPFLISIASAATQILHIVDSQKSDSIFGMNDVMRDLFYNLPILLSVHMFIWAFCRSIFIIAVLDMGRWAKSDLFGKILGNSGSGWRRGELVLRFLIIVTFLDHHIVMAEVLGAPIAEAYGMSGGCGLAGSSGSNWFWSLPFTCGFFQTSLLVGDSIFDTAWVPMSASHSQHMSIEILKQTMSLMVLSGGLVSFAILLWSFYVGGLYKHWQRTTTIVGTNRRVKTMVDLQQEFDRSMSKFNVQRFCVGFNAFCSLLLIAWIFDSAAGVLILGGFTILSAMGYIRIISMQIASDDWPHGSAVWIGSGLRYLADRVSPPH